MLFDRSQLKLRPIAQRRHLLNRESMCRLDPTDKVRPELSEVAGQIKRSRAAGAEVIAFMGAHVLRSGVQPYLRDLMSRGLMTCLSLNGAGLIHDFEFALLGATTESVADYIKDGSFGLWEEVGRLNDLAREAAAEGLGLGAYAGKVIAEGDFPHKDLSILAHAHRLDLPCTVHVGIGYDIVYEHPNCDGAAWGQASYSDFLRLAAVLDNLAGGVVLNLGTAVMGPEIFLKALAMARNLAARQGREIGGFATLVCDLVDLPGDYRRQPRPEEPGYYFRPWKTLLVRTLEGSQSYYVKGRHRETIPQLWTALR